MLKKLSQIQTTHKYIYGKINSVNFFEKINLNDKCFLEVLLIKSYFS
jgi:hypothetical protein